MMRRQFPTLGRKLALDFLPKVGEGEKHSLYHSLVAIMCYHKERI